MILCIVKASEEGNAVIVWKYEGYSKIKLRLAGKKKIRIENKTFLYGTVTYLTELLLHIVAIHI
jgi:hypothetical protein